MLTDFRVYLDGQRLITIVKVVLQQFLSYNNRIVTVGIYIGKDIRVAFIAIRIRQIGLEVGSRIFRVKRKFGFLKF